MTAKELAEMLDHREVGEEVEWGEERDIKGAGLVVVYGYNTSQDQTAYERAMQAAQLQRQQQEQAAELARAQVDAMLSAGVRPSDSLVAGSGYQGEYVQALENYYRQQNAPKASGGGRSSGGSLGSSGGGKPNLTWSQTRKEIEAGNLSPAVLAAYEYYMGEEYRQVGGGNASGGTVTAPSQLGEKAQAIARGLSGGTRGPSNIISRVESALDKGEITEAEADYLLTLVGA